MLRDRQGRKEKGRRRGQREQRLLFRGRGEASVGGEERGSRATD